MIDNLKGEIGVSARQGSLPVVFTLARLELVNFLLQGFLVESLTELGIGRGQGQAKQSVKRVEPRIS